MCKNVLVYLCLIAYTNVMLIIGKPLLTQYAIGVFTYIVWDLIARYQTEKTTPVVVKVLMTLHVTLGTILSAIMFSKVPWGSLSLLVLMAMLSRVYYNNMTKKGGENVQS